MVLRTVKVVCPCVWGFFFCSSTKHESIPRSLSRGVTPSEVFFCYSIPVLGLASAEAMQLCNCGGGIPFRNMFLRP